MILENDVALKIHLISKVTKRCVTIFSLQICPFKSLDQANWERKIYYVGFSLEKNKLLISCKIKWKQNKQKDLLDSVNANHFHKEGSSKLIEAE